MKKILLGVLIIVGLISPISLSAKTINTADIEQLSDGVLTFGTNCEFAPYEFTVNEADASDTAIPISGSNAYCDGYDMMWASKIGDYLGVDIELVSMSFDGLIPALNSGTIDSIIAGLSATPERAEQIDFTDNYFNTNLVMSVVTTKDNKYANATSVDDLDGATLSSQLATFHGDILKGIDGVNVADPLEGVDVLIQATKAGTIDGYLTEHKAAASQAESNSDLVYNDITDIEIDPAYSGYAIATAKGDEALKDAMNSLIDTVDDEEKTAMMDEASQKADGTWIGNSSEKTDDTSNSDLAKFGEELEDGVLTVGTDCAFAPYAFAVSEDNVTDTSVKVSNSNGYCDGYDIMIAENLADYFGVDLEVKVISFDGLIPALNSGEIDAITASMSPTPDRQSQLNFSDNYYDSDLVMSIVTTTDSEYASATDSTGFDGAKISSQLGTFHGDVLPLIPNIITADPLESPDVLMQATKAGTIDGYITEHEVAVEQVESSDELTYIDLNDLDLDAGFSGVAVGIRKGSDTFTNSVNTALSTISDKQRSKMMEEATEKDEGTYEQKDSFLGETWQLFITNKSLYASGIKATLLLALFGTVFGVLIGFVLVAMRIQKVHYKDNRIVKVLKKVLSTVAIVYIDIIRGTPMMVQAMLFFYGLAANIMEPNTAGIVIISFNTAAYVAEILRSGINSLDSGQMEAGRSLGLSEMQTFINVIAPQTIKNTLPALANQLVLNIKDSSVLSVIAVSELFYATKQAASAGYMYTQAYFISAVIYLILTVALTRILVVVMRKMFSEQEVENAMTLE